MVFETFKFTSKEDVNQFYDFWKRCNDKQIFETKKKDYDNKNIENIFQQNIDNTWYEHLEIKTKRTITHALPN